MKLSELITSLINIQLSCDFDSEVTVEVGIKIRSAQKDSMGVKPIEFVGYEPKQKKIVLISEMIENKRGKYV